MMQISTEVQIALIGAVLLLILVLIFKDRVSELVFGPARMTLFSPREIEEAIDEAAEIAQEEVPETSAPMQVNWNRVATLFWLGNDLMWITDMIYRSASPQRVLQGVEHAKEYLKRMGFEEGEFPIEELELAENLLQHLVGLDTSSPSDSRLLKQHYKSVVKNIQTVKWFINARAKEKEPDFEKLRAL